LSDYDEKHWVEYQSDHFAYKMHLDFETKIGRKKYVLYTGVYGILYIYNNTNLFIYFS